MNKTVKGILALVAAVILLAAGYGTYAQWTDSSVIGGGTIGSGQLKLNGADACVWRDASAASPGTVIPNIATFLIVPGDIVTCTLTRTVSAEGANLSAALAADPASVTGDAALLAAMQITTGITVNGTTATAITPANNGQTVVATVRFNFPFASTNATQLQSLNLANLRLTLTQNPR